MRKRIAIVLAIAMITVIMVASFVGCTKPLDEKEGLEYLNKAIEDTANAKQYYIKIIAIKTIDESAEIRLNVFKDDPDTKKNEAGIQIQTLHNNKLAYNAIFGNSLKKGAKEKKATDADWKKDVMFVAEKNKDGKLEFNSKKPIPTSKEAFLTNPELGGVSMNLLMTILGTFVNGEMKPNKITRTGHITEYTYNDIGKETAKMFGADTSVDAKSYPLTVETINGKVSKVVIEPVIDGATGKDHLIKYYITMQGPNVNVPKWEA